MGLEGSNRIGDHMEFNISGRMLTFLDVLRESLLGKAKAVSMRSGIMQSAHVHTCLNNSSSASIQLMFKKGRFRRQASRRHSNTRKNMALFTVLAALNGLLVQKKFLFAEARKPCKTFRRYRSHKSFIVTSTIH